MIQPGGLSSTNQAGAPAAFPYGHIPQLTTQMQGLQITHHSGANIGGYLPPHQWPPVWSHHISMQQHQSGSIRPPNPLQNQQPNQQQGSAPISDAPQNFPGNQEGSQDMQSKQSSVSEIGKPIQVSAPL